MVCFFVGRCGCSCAGGRGSERRWFSEWPEELDLAGWDGEDLEGVECVVVFLVVFIRTLAGVAAGRPSSPIECLHPSRRPKCPLTP